MFEVSLGDLNENEDSFRKFKLIIEETQGKICLTNFHGMDLTTDKLRSMIKKKQVKKKKNEKNPDFKFFFNLIYLF